jgi:hypothetical protein
MSSTGGGDDKVVQFPTTAEERRALQRAKQEAERRRLADLFVDEASGQALFHTPDDECFADLVVGGVRQTWPVKSKRFRAEYVRYLRRRLESLSAPMITMVGSAFKKSNINTAIDDFELKALSSSVVREVHVRVARDGDHLFIDLSDPDWRAVRVTGDGWSVVDSPPVRFLRTPDMLPLSLPERGGSIDELRQFLPGLNEGDNFTLTVAFLLAALQPSGPYPVLVIYGQQGWAKTGLLRILRACVDPNKVMTAPLPASRRDLYVAARNVWLQTFENISRISDPMSDHLCRLATGGGERTRSLFTNKEETTFAGSRPIAMEGISSFVVRPDLLDRSIILALEKPPSARKTERQLWAEFDQHKARIFGALLDMLVAGIRRVPETRLVNLPRMCDFATLCVACGLDRFEAAYAGNRQSAIDVMLEHDLVALAVKAFMATRREWRGAAWQLLSELSPAIRITDPREFASRLRRLAPPLLTHGLSISEEPRRGALRPLVIAWTDGGGDAQT